MTRPNPSQTRGDDQVILRRELKQLLPGDVALDQAELRELLDLSNVGGRYDVLRLKLLRRAVAQLGASDVLRSDQYTALLDYRQGRGPRPSFARLVTPDGHFAGESVLSPAELRPQTTAPGPVMDPGEPGRYVQPSGRFALTGEKGFTPDTR
jgi:hypothetical protein